MMASIIEGYNYDVFISYRQKDNKHDGWVTEFVYNLKGELESTFKEEISVYFDINPLDGLLETHDVDESLKEKLKCLVFIPIISRTYCDPKSFAWEHEFKVFVDQASQDQFGLKVKLPGGNVATRVLPVLIHDLDKEDIKLCESIIGGVLRGVEFVYKEAGVNRSLTLKDDERKNLNGTIYRNQINKVSNAIKEIITGLKNFGKPILSMSFKDSNIKETSLIRHDKSIAVLPFQDMSPKNDQEYFCDGMTEEIINALTHVESLKVIARTSSFAFKDKHEDIREIGRKLDVETLLEGSIRKDGDRLRITAQLVKVADGFHIWSERYDRDLKDIFAIQDEISLAIVDNLKIKLLGEGKSEIVKRYTEDLETYNLLLKGRYFHNKGSEEGVTKAIEYFEKVIEKVPDSAQAYAGLAGCHISLGGFDFLPPKIAFSKAKEAALRAIEIDQTLSEAHASLGMVNLFYYRDWKGAEIELKKAIDLNPSYALAHHYYALYFVALGRLDEAIAENERAVELDPLSSTLNGFQGFSLLRAGRLEQAREKLRKALELEPNYSQALWLLGQTYILEFRYEEGLFEIKKALDLSKNNTMILSGLGWAYAVSDRKSDAQKVIVELKRRTNKEYIRPYLFAKIHAALGEKDRAFEWLKKAYEEHDVSLALMLSDETLVMLHTDQRFNRLLKKINL